MKVFLPLFISIITFNFCLGKNNDHDDPSALKARTLLVILEEDPGADETNTLLKKIFSKNWKFNSSIEYKKRGEAEDILQSGTNEYLVFQCSTYGLAGQTPPEETKNKFFDIPSDNYVVRYDEFGLKLSEDFDKKNMLNATVFYCIYFFGLAERTEANLTIQLKVLQAYLKREKPPASQGRHDYGSTAYNNNVLANFPRLKDKTLLIVNEPMDMKSFMQGKPKTNAYPFLDPGLTTEQIKAVYPFPFKIASKEEYQNAILNSDPDKAVILYNLIRCVYLVVDCETGDVLDYYYTSKTSYMFELKKYHLKSLGIAKFANF